MIDSILGKATTDRRHRRAGHRPARPDTRRERGAAHRAQVTPDFLAHLAPVLQGPVGLRAALQRTGRLWRQGDRPRLGCRAHPQADGRIAAVLALGSPVDKGFAALFEVGRPGLSGETLAFDAEGWLLSPSRHAAAMHAQGCRRVWRCPATRTKH
jgi:hypothetical protein